MKMQQNSGKMKLNMRSRIGKVQIWKNQFWQRNGQTATLLLLDHLPIKVDLFLSYFCYGYSLGIL